MFFEIIVSQLDEASLVTLLFPVQTLGKFTSPVC